MARFPPRALLSFLKATFKVEDYRFCPSVRHAIGREWVDATCRWVALELVQHDIHDYTRDGYIQP